jgi:hypothetical protein
VLPDHVAEGRKPESRHIEARMIVANRGGVAAGLAPVRHSAIRDWALAPLKQHWLAASTS